MAFLLYYRSCCSKLFKNAIHLINIIIMTRCWFGNAFRFCRIVHSLQTCTAFCGLFSLSSSIFPSHLHLPFVCFELSGFFVVAALQFLCPGFCWTTPQMKRLVLIDLAQQTSLFFDFRSSTVSVYSRAFGMIILERLYFSVCDEHYIIGWLMITVRALLRNDLSEDPETSFCYNFLKKPPISLPHSLGGGADKVALDGFDNFLTPVSAVNFMTNYFI